MLRSPVVCILAHVDHGKTSILDYIRGSAVAKKEAGGITQMIGAYYLPKDTITHACGPLEETAKKSLKVPGLLFIDTPGHEAFTSMRERGGSIADFAILVIDIMQGIQPQTLESLRILKANRTPFIIALNKVDLVSGWKKVDTPSITKAMQEQQDHVQNIVEEKLYTVVGKLSEMGMESERYDRVTDYTKQITIVPCSAKSGEGMAELLMYLSGLCQKFLSDGLEAHVSGPAKGSIIEVKEEKGLGTTLDVIIYDGKIAKNDLIAFGTKEGAQVAKVRGLLRPPIPGEKTQGGSRYVYVDQIPAAAGIKVYAPGLEGALAGSPIKVVQNQDLEKEVEEEIDAQLKKILVSEKNLAGVVIKTDTLGSAEAFMRILTSANVPIKEISIGPVAKKDILTSHTTAIQNKYLGVVMAFNVPVNEDAQQEAKNCQIPIFTSKVIYALLDDYLKWSHCQKERDTSQLMENAPYPAKLISLPNCFFRLNKPAIFGVKILAGKLKPKTQLMNSTGEIIGQLKAIQLDGKSVQEAKKGDEVAISVDGPYCGKTFKQGDELYTFINKIQAQTLQNRCTEVLDQDEKKLLQDIIDMTTEFKI